MATIVVVILRSNSTAVDILFRATAILVACIEEATPTLGAKITWLLVSLQLTYEGRLVTLGALLEIRTILPLARFAGLSLRARLLTLVNAHTRLKAFKLRTRLDPNLLVPATALAKAPFRPALMAIAQLLVDPIGTMKVQKARETLARVTLLLEVSAIAPIGVGPFF